MESVAGILYTLDGSGMLRGWNRRLEYVTQFQPEELQGRPVPEMFEEEDRAAVAAVIRAAAHGGHGEREARLVCKDGTPIPYQFSCVPLRNSQGEVIGLTGVGTDISERKRLEQQLWQLQKMDSWGAWPAEWPMISVTSSPSFTFGPSSPCTASARRSRPARTSSSSTPRPPAREAS